jgi:Uma2 family endonuclease
MSTASRQSSIPATPPPAPVNGASQKTITWEAFQRRYLSREDGYKYEWVGGMVEKTRRTMDRTQLYLLRNLADFFISLKIKGKVKGQLISEPDLFFLANHRRPDICWLTDEQIDKLADPNAYEVPAFIIEVISSNDQINKVKQKMVNYREAGVKVVWHVFPQLRQVDVYSGDRLGNMTVSDGDQLCSASPVLTDFKLPASAIFQQPANTKK